MEQKQGGTYSKEFKEQVVKECRETGEAGSVARKFDLPPTTVYSWIRKHKNIDKNPNKKTIKNMEKELDDARLEISILKELLKKSHQLWLKNQKSPRIL